MWDQRYAEQGFAYGSEPNDFLVEQAGRIRPGGKVLCLAEGEGRNAVWLAGRGFEVTAIDQSAVGLAKAAKLAAERGVQVKWVQGDLAVFSLEPGAWDGIVSIWAHTPPSIRVPLHRRVVEGLRPGGVLVLESYAPAQIALGTGGPKEPALLMTEAGLRAELSGLDFAVAVEREREVREGKYHQGRSAVVQVVAVKPGAG